MLETRIELVGKLNNTIRLLEPTTEELEVTSSQEKQVVTPKEGIHGFNKVTVNKIPSEYIKPSGTIDITLNGEYDVNSYEKAKVNVGGNEITDASYLFYNGARLNIKETLIGMLSENLTNINRMFSQCSSLIEVPLFNTSEVTNFEGMFYSCANLTKVPLFNTGKATSTDTMFYRCYALTEVPLFDFSQNKIMRSMFDQCTSLIKVPQFNTSNVTNMSQVFSSCTNLIEVPEFDAGKVEVISSAFYKCSALTTFGGLKDLGKGYPTYTSANNSSCKLDLSYCTSLTYESLMNVINKLYDIASIGVQPQQLVLGSTNLAKLEATEEGQQAIVLVQTKGWNVS